MKKFLFISLSIIILFNFLVADVYIKTKTHTDPFEIMGKKQPAKDDIQEQWIGDGQYATMMPNQTMVLDLNKNVLYIIYPETKTYLETSLPLDLSKILPQQIAQMMSMMKMTVKVTANGQTKQIGNWKCQGYDIDMSMSMMNMKMTSWATKDVPFDWKNFAEKLLPTIMKSSGQMFMDDTSLDEFKKIKGFQIASEMKMSVMGANVVVTSQVAEITKKSPPAGIYAVPAGYTKQDKLSLPKRNF